MIARLRFIKPISFNKWNNTVLSLLRTFSQDLWKNSKLFKQSHTDKEGFIPTQEVLLQEIFLWVLLV